AATRSAITPAIPAVPAWTSEPEILFVPCPRSKLESAPCPVPICITRYVVTVLVSGFADDPRRLLVVWSEIRYVAVPHIIETHNQVLHAGAGVGMQHFVGDRNRLVELHLQ